MTATRKFNWSVPTKPAEDDGERSALFALGSPEDIAAIVRKGISAGLLVPRKAPAKAVSVPLAKRDRPPERALRGEAEGQVRQMWIRTQRGESAREIAVALKVSIASVRRLVAEIRKGERALPRPTATEQVRRH
jgi:hypothetical protein